MNEGRDRRRHFRLRYPGDARPTVRVDGVEHALLEVSVRGLRVAAKAGEFATGRSCTVELILPNVRPIAIDEGVVLRWDGGECILWLSDEIDHAVILCEQRRLIRRARKLRDVDALDLMRTRHRRVSGS